MKNFKVGDRVKITKDWSDGANVRNGDKGTIVELNLDMHQVKPDFWRPNTGVSIWYIHANSLTRLVKGKKTSKKLNPKEKVTPAWYIDNAIKTDLLDYNPVTERLNNHTTARILHAAMGLCTESAELMDALKKHLIYGKELDLVNLKEEASDTFWYLAILADELGLSFEEIMKTNIDKLKARYGDKFSEKSALNRDLGTERKILEGYKK